MRITVSYCYLKDKFNIIDYREELLSNLVYGKLIQAAA
jgi:hypothetical protein